MTKPATYEPQEGGAMELPASRGLELLDPLEACVLRANVSVLHPGSNRIEARAGGFCLAGDWFRARLGAAEWELARSSEPRALLAAAPTGHLLEALAGDAMRDLGAAIEGAGLVPVKMEAASEIGSEGQGLRATLYALAEAPSGGDPLELAERAVSRFLAPAPGLMSGRDARWVGAGMDRLSGAREALETLRLARIEAREIGGAAPEPAPREAEGRRL